MGIVLQYTKVYCDRQEGHKAELCRNTTQLSHDMAARCAAQRLQHGTTPCDTAISACDTVGGHGHDTVAVPTTRPCARAPVRTWVCWLG